MYRVTATIDLPASDALNARDQITALVRNAKQYGYVPSATPFDVVNVEEIEQPQTSTVQLTLTDAEQRIVEETLRRFRAQ